MTTITLPPEIEQSVARQAERQGTTTELVILDTLRRMFTPVEEPTPQKQMGSLYDLLEKHIGVIASGEHTLGGAQMATDSGKKFAEGMARKRREGKL